MRERPILFSGPMVRAILADRKTQTRRLAQFPLRSRSDGAKRRIFTEQDVAEVNQLLLGPQRSPLRQVACPYGVPGDRLWAKETFALSLHDPETTDPDVKNPAYWDPPVYRADGDNQGGGWTRRTESGSDERIDPPWRPSIFLPRWASRITLAVTKVRIQRLQDITQSDAAAEGLSGPLVDPELDKLVNQIGRTPRDAFAELWDAINGKRAPWSSNPWVWAVEFCRVAAGGKCQGSATTAIARLE